MKTLLTIFLLFLGMLGEAHAMPAHLSRCEASFLIPREVRRATRDLLRATAPDTLQQARREQLRAFVDRAPVASREVLAYLFAFEQDALEAPRAQSTDWAAFLRNRYLMRLGNEELAFENLERFLEAYWLDFILGTGHTRGEKRFERGLGWMQEQTLFLIELSGERPQFVKWIWGESLNLKLPYLVNLREVTNSINQASAFLKFFLSMPEHDLLPNDDMIAGWIKLQFLNRFVADLDWVPESFDEFTVLRFTPRGSPYEEGWAGSEVDSISPSQVAVFLFRLTRYTGLSSAELDTFIRAVDKLRGLLKIYREQNI